MSTAIYWNISCYGDRYSNHILQRCLILYSSKPDFRYLIVLQIHLIFCKQWRLFDYNYDLSKSSFILCLQYAQNIETLLSRLRRSYNF